jgi:phosphoribosylformylglycinamidine synthase II
MAGEGVACYAGDGMPSTRSPNGWPDDRTLEQIALTRDEYALIVERLGREPNEVELGMIGALWSEHCGYKNSRPLLRLFPTEGPGVLTRAGQENAGVVELGDGLCIAMKIESHNHPSAIEPYQGAATGVGGIVRDVFAMGARPIAILDSLRFGPIVQRPEGPPPDVVARNRRLLVGVVSGIGGYGNCLGVPTVGGEVSFGAAYSSNPLVNAMCVGVARVDRLARARAEGPGNILMLVGADTGKDGIHGATFASVELDERSEERRPAVQVGNPFMEKLLMEACLELANEHPDWFTGLQDLGAAGLTSAAVECAAKAGTGVVVDVAKVPRRERGMTPYDVMLSESQERMLVIARREHAEDVRRLFERWELHVAEVGYVIDEPVAIVRDGEHEVARLPVRLLTEPPTYVREGVKPAWLTDLQESDLSKVPDIAPGEAGETLLRLLCSPEIGSKRWVWRQYDHQVGNNTVLGPGGDAAVLRVDKALPGPPAPTKRGVALTTDGNGLYCLLDPFEGGKIAVAEAARNVVCVGARPVAVTDCLNFGNPEKPEVYYQLEQAIRGMSEACRALGTPVISGNVSLYNETSGEPVYPTPVVGMLGVLDDVTRRVAAAFREPGDAVVLLGQDALDGDTAGIGASEYLREVHGVIAGRPRIDLDLEARLQAMTLEAIERGLVRSAHDCSHGGLAVTLAECAIMANLGFDGDGVVTRGRLDAALFGERQSRIVVSAAASDVDALLGLAADHAVPAMILGHVSGAAEARFRLGPGGSLVDLPLPALVDAYESGFPDALAGTPVAADVHGA